ncbi:MAG TPA: hypothetical protein VFW47_10175 [Phenylobacterium sp.]|nr:hypothetical protein [Phenylobacterium sp.]
MKLSKTQRALSLALVIVAAGAGFAAAEASGSAENTAPPPLAPRKMSFFITSTGPGKGGDLGGLAGADAWCQSLAAKAGAGGRTWRAYLSSTGDGTGPVNARDRIGKGPWFNARGVQVAASVEDLHSPGNHLGKQVSLSELGEQINGRGDTPNTHDIMTGSTADGRLAPPVAPPPPANAPAGTPAPAAPDNLTCNNWTSSGPSRTMLGHHDRQGGGPDPTSWNAAHQSRSCSQPDLVATGGKGLFYCFAIN